MALFSAVYLQIQVPSTSQPSSPSPPSPHKDVSSLSAREQQRPSVTPDEVQQFFLEYHQCKEEEEEEEEEEEKGEEVSGMIEGGEDGDDKQSSEEGKPIPLPAV